MILKEILEVLDPGLIIMIRDKDGFAPPLYSGDIHGVFRMKRNLFNRRVVRITKDIWECAYHIAIKIGGEDEHEGSEEGS